MDRKEIAARITTKSTWTARKGYTTTAYFQGQEIGSCSGMRFKDRSIAAAIEIGTEAVICSLSLQDLASDIVTLLNNDWLKDLAPVGLNYLQANSRSFKKLEQLKARCKELIIERIDAQGSFAIAA